MGKGTLIMNEKSHITADSHKLMEDGANAATYYMGSAVENIERKFGKGYAKEHPELVGAYINAASRDTLGAEIAKSILELRDSMDEFRETFWISIENIGDKIT
jgi:hypothetical protein